MHTCLTCSLLVDRNTGQRPLWDNIYRTPFWDVVHSYNTALPGWLVLVARRHIEAIADLSREESRELGDLITTTSQALHAAVHCRKTYIIQFAEATEHQHVHVHVVPRMVNQPEDRRGPQIFGYLGVAEHERVAEDTMNRIAADIRLFLTTHYRVE
jgi:diadenosine tetraphosphate (Ap4A) HIT family hydrolase